MRKLTALFVGLFLFSLGILLTIHANLGAAPWDAFHLGIVKHTGLNLGRVSQLVGIFLLVLCILLKEKPGWGTLANIYFIGFFIDLIEGTGYLPHFDNFWLQLAMLLTGILSIGWGTALYISVGWGSGPRDGLMLGLTRLLSIQLWQARTGIEGTVCLLGYFLGGPIGFGTIVTASLLGPSVQLAFSILRLISKRSQVQPLEQGE
ncbi:MAG: YczE/YyaS/YitT family protein [Limnochordia bacterium]|jgi:uncharacterized membrane protein YczE